MNRYRHLGTAITVFAVLLMFSGVLVVQKIQRTKVAGVSDHADPSGIVGILVPHHNVASQLLNESYTRIASNRYKNVVIIGTNHNEIGESRFIVGDDIVVTKENASPVSTLISNQDIFRFDNHAISKDHSISSQLPYIYEYLGSVESITPILAGYNYNMDYIESVVSLLLKVFPRDTLFIASVDFSHDNIAEEGLDKNSIILDSIKNKKYQEILRMDNRYVDSPSTVVAVTMLMERLGAYKFNLWESSHSSMLLDSASLFGTSYLTGSFIIDEIYR